MFVYPGSQQNLTNFFDILGHVFLWSVVTTFIIYLIGGLLWMGLLRIGQRRWYNVIPGVLFLLSAVWKLMSSDIIICSFIAGIYVTLDEALRGEHALLWGVGLSLSTVIINTLIACLPIYSVL